MLGLEEDGGMNEVWIQEDDRCCTLWVRKEPELSFKKLWKKIIQRKKRNQNSLWTWQSQKENLIFVYSLAGRLFYSRIDLLSYLSSVLSWSSLWSQKLVEDKILVLSKCIVTFEFKDVCFCHSILVE